jgi:hypothetical protein
LLAQARCKIGLYEEGAMDRETTRRAGRQLERRRRQVGTDDGAIGAGQIGLRPQPASTIRASLGTALSRARANALAPRARTQARQIIARRTAGKTAAELANCTVARRTARIRRTPSCSG